MYKKLPTIFLPIYIIIEKIIGKKFVTVRSGLIFTESLVIDKNDIQVLSFFNSLFLKELNIKKKSRIIVIHDKRNKRIYKFSSKESCREVKNNYQALDFVSCLDAPKKISIIDSDLSVLSVEEYIDSLPLDINVFNHDIYNDSLFHEICKKLHEYHSKSLKKVKTTVWTELNHYDFLLQGDYIKDLSHIKIRLLELAQTKLIQTLYKAYIHGDATYRNVLYTNNQLSFIDFERSAFDFPEIDYLNFVLDFNTHKDLKPSYKNYIDYLVDIYINNQYIQVFEMLQSNEDLQLINIDNLQFVYLKYLIRQISIVTNVSFYHGGVEIRSIYRSINKKLNNLSTKPS